jgi:hypothetical protein
MAYRSFVGSGRLSPASIRRLSQAVVTQIPSYLLRRCYNFHDFRRLARRRLPSPIFNYIDGGADDEVTHHRNTASFERCDLVPSVLRGVESVDPSVTVMGQRLAVPFYCSPTALQRLFHHQGERRGGLRGLLQFASKPMWGIN